MLTLLFYTRYHCVSSKGGTEHTTITVAKKLLEDYDIHSISTYTHDFAGEAECFDAEYKLSKNKKEATEQIQDIITKHGVDFVIIQGYFHEIGIFRHAIKGNNKCHLIFTHHFNPGWEQLKRGEVDDKIKKSKGYRRVKYKVKLKLFPIFLKLNKYNLSKRYRSAYKYADKVVLLSSDYIDKFEKQGHFNDKSKFCVIPNALSFTNSFNIADYPKKEKTVLIVSRLDERQKRIHLALNIWKQAKENENLKDWKLQILGDGDQPCVKDYISWSKSHDIPNVEFFGRKNPFPFYQKASVFMMTSACEGLPLTIMEAQQQGVVPIVFNTFDSIHDIINHGQNGFIIKETDVCSYVKTLENLLSDEGLRKDIAENALTSQQKFSKEVIMKKWIEMFQEIL
jgi:glycosyltransferase involved in cell wall biosynthesis